MLQVRNVRKVYDDRAVVNDVSFDVQSGEIFALLGPNGAGKTTLIRMITDILKPDAGTVRLDGQAVGAGKKARIAYLPEERGLYRKVAILDALRYQGELKGMSARDARAQSVALLEEFGLATWAKKQGSALSKGMQQKVQLCTALIGDPELLILDEPFSGLDPVNVALLEEVLKRRRAAGTTVLLSTHQMNKVEQQCDRALMINRGHMVLYGTVREIRMKYAEHAFVIEGGEVPMGVPGVKSVTRQNGSTKLQLERGARSNDVLRALLDRGVDVASFTPVVPPLEDIFVHVVETGAGLDQGKSGPPTVDELQTPIGGGR